MTIHMLDDRELLNLKINYIFKGMNLIDEFDRMSESERDTILGDMDKKIAWIENRLRVDDGK